MKIFCLTMLTAEDRYRMSKIGYGDDSLKLQAPRLFATLELAKKCAHMEATTYADQNIACIVWSGSMDLNEANIDDDNIHLLEVTPSCTVWTYRVLQDPNCIAEWRIYGMEVYQQ
jgi:hypothetical protein